MLKKILTKVKQLLRHIFLLIAILMVTTPAWAECNYNINNPIKSISTTKKTKKQWWGTETYYQFPESTIIGSVNNTHGISKISATITLEIAAAGKDATVYFEYSSNNGQSWTEIDSKTLEGSYSLDGSNSLQISTETTINKCDNVQFRIRETKQEEYGSSRTISISNFNVTLASAIQASLSSWDFGVIGMEDARPTKNVTITYSNAGTTISATDDSEHFFVSPKSETIDCTGSKTFTITYDPQYAGKHSGTITITTKEGSTTIKTVTLSVFGTTKGYPVHTWNGSSKYYVGDQIDLLNTWSSTNTNTPRNYSIVQFTETSTINDGATTPYIDPNNKLILEKAGKLKIRMEQSSDETYSQLTSVIELDIIKRPTQFSHILQSPYYIGDWANLSDVYTKSDNGLNVIFATSDANVVSVSDGKIVAQNKGTATITITQPENYKWTAINETIDLTINKHTPKFNVTSNIVNYNHNQTNGEEYTDFVYVTCDEHTSGHNYDAALYADVQLTSYTTSNPVATLRAGSTNSKLHLSTLNDESVTSITLTIEQKETRYWEYKKQDITINLANQNNHVPFTMNTKELRVALYEDHEKTNGNNSCDDNGEISLNQNGGLEVWTANPLYYTIEFTGIPDKLTFNYSKTATATAIGSTGKAFIVYESYNGQDWAEVWSSNGMPNNTNDNLVSDIPLKYTTKYLKFFYDGTYTGYYSNINVTELNIFEANPTELDFGANQVDKTDHPQKTFALHYANAGYKVTLTSTNDKFTVSPTEINTIGGEKYGTYAPITVTYNTDTEHLTNNEGYIIVTDECGHETKVLVKGSTYKIPQSLYWTENWQAEEPAMRINSSATDVARSTNSTLSVTYKSSDESIINVTNDGTTLQALAKGSATITASQVGNDDWAPAESISKTFIVTDKIIQYIHWTDNLTRLLTTDNTIKLNAKIQINDTEGNRIDEPERTKLIKYYSVNESIVSVTEDGTLTIKGAGETYVVAYEAGDEHYYEQVYLAMPVRVRVPSTGCTNYVLSRPDEIEFFQMNTNEIIRDEIELDPNKGIPGKLSFQHSGAKWLSLAYSGSIKAQQKVNGEWYDIAGSEVTPSVDSWQECNNLELNENATSIRFVRPANGTGYHYVKDVLITPARYIRSNLTEINFGEIVVGSDETKPFTIVYSDMQSEYQLTTSDPQQLTLLNNIIVNDCGAWGQETNSLTFKPNTVKENYQETITIKDELGDITHTILVRATIKKGNQSITWEPKTKTLSESSDWREGYTKNATSSIGLPITYTIESNDYADFDTNGNLIIKKTGGSFTITANQDGDDNFNAATPVSIEFNIPSDISPIPTFIGGQEDNDWTNILNWNFNRLPSATEEVCIKAPATLSTNATIAGITFATGDNEQIGSIHITSTGGLSVGTQGITGAATDGSSLTIDNLQTGAGFLRIDPAYTGTMPRITMRYQTKSTLDNGANKDATWQYIGAPGANCQFTVDYITWLYHWDEKQGWMNKTGTITLEPFAGYAITQYGQPTYSLITEPTNQNTTITLTKTDNGNGMKGDNLFANSYTAPIDAKNFTPEDFEGDLEKTFYIFNSGSWNDWNKQNQNNSTLGGNDSNTPGQYCAIPALASQYLDNTYDITTIPPMQGVYVIANKNGATIKLDYNKHVWCAGSTEDLEKTNMNEAMRAPQHKAQMQDENFRRIRIQLNSTNSGADRMYVIQTSETTSEYDNGYDAPNLVTEGLANIYTTEPFGNMEVSCSNNIDSMSIGFQAGVDTEYTLSFGALIGDSLYLQDLENDSIIQIVEKEQYHFTATPYSINNHRFQLLLHRQLSSNNDNTTTAIEDIYNTTKIWSQDKTVYILNAPENSIAMIYSVSGHHILSTPINNHPSPAVIDLYQLPEGVYIIRINNQMYKFVCK